MSGGIINKLKILSELLRLQNIIFLAYLLLASFWLIYILSSNYPIILSGFHTTTYTFSQYIWTWAFPCILIMTMGNLINDFYDRHGDIINHKRPLGRKDIEMSTFKAVGVIVFAMTLIYLVIISTLELSFGLEIFLFAIISLFIYSKWLKGWPILGNVLVGLLSAIPFMPLYSSLSGVKDIYGLFSLGFILLIFLSTIIREFVKDIEDMKGDQATNLNTLPVLIGKHTSIRILPVLLIITTSVITCWLASFHLAMITFGIIFSVIPLLFLAWKVHTKKNISGVSSFLKYHMMSSSLLIFIFGFIYKS